MRERDFLFPASVLIENCLIQDIGCLTQRAVQAEVLPRVPYRTVAAARPGIEIL